MHVLLEETRDSACMVAVVILLVGGHSFHCDTTDVLFVLLAVCVYVCFRLELRGYGWLDYLCL